jgi:hypothetical protein
LIIPLTLVPAAKAAIEDSKNKVVRPAIITFPLQFILASLPFIVINRY